MNDPRVLAPLREAMLHDAVARVRIAAAGALARHGDAEATHLLLQQLAQVDANSSYYYDIPQALAESRSMQAVEPLCKMLSSENSFLHYKASHALLRLFDTSADPLISRQIAPLLLAEAKKADETEERLEYLTPLAAHRDARAIAPLSAILTEYTGGPVTRCVALLRKIGGKKAVAPLRNALYSPSISVREAAVDALGALGDHVATPMLRALVRIDTTRVRVKAIAALGRLNDRQAVPILRAVLREKGTRVRAAAAQAL